MVGQLRSSFNRLFGNDEHSVHPFVIPDLGFTVRAAGMVDVTGLVTLTTGINDKPSRKVVSVGVGNGVVLFPLLECGLFLMVELSNVLANDLTC